MLPAPLSAWCGGAEELSIIDGSVSNKTNTVLVLSRGRRYDDRELADHRSSRADVESASDVRQREILRDDGLELAAGDETHRAALSVLSSLS